MKSRLDSIKQEMNHRSDIGTVFLPQEFSPAAADGEQIQLEMQVVEARAFLDRMKSAAVAWATQLPHGQKAYTRECIAIARSSWPCDSGWDFLPTSPTQR
jgi:hypothetical protein